MESMTEMKRGAVTLGVISAVAAVTFLIVYRQKDNPVVGASSALLLMASLLCMCAGCYKSPSRSAERQRFFSPLRVTTIQQSDEEAQTAYLSCRVV